MPSRRQDSSEVTKAKAGVLIPTASDGTFVQFHL
jgi:hypothetical protein